MEDFLANDWLGLDHAGLHTAVKSVLKIGAPTRLREVEVGYLVPPCVCISHER